MKMPIRERDAAKQYRALSNIIPQQEFDDWATTLEEAADEIAVLEASMC